MICPSPHHQREGRGSAFSAIGEVFIGVDVLRAFYGRFRAFYGDSDASVVPSPLGLSEGHLVPFSTLFDDPLDIDPVTPSAPL